ncbi:MAG: PEP-CTERM sorting domain-containing protein [Candidatus Omnitrophica bacterium]|nr:PEP-CTERM sorting domain-containing protein [Candidatus Omnitrophota bacterium]
MKSFQMGRAIFVSILLGVLTTATQAISFDDIDFWVGSGGKEAAFVVDWNDGIDPVSIAWGYRWEETATGEDMLKAIVMADPRLFAKVTTPGGFGVSLIGLGYDLDSNGFSLTDGTLFIQGLAITGGSDTATAGDTNDHYREGFFSAGYWSYWVGTGNPYEGGSWGFAGSGMSGRTLIDGAWDGWSWAPRFASSVPGEPVPAEFSDGVPEPATVALLSTGVIAVVGRRRTRVV